MEELRAHCSHEALAPRFSASIFFTAKEAWRRTPRGKRATNGALPIVAGLAPAFSMKSAIVAAIVHAGKQGGRGHRIIVLRCAL